MEPPYSYVIWVCVVLFAVLSLILVLALVGLVKLGKDDERHDKYLNRLFKLIIVPIVGAAVGAFASHMNKSSVHPQAPPAVSHVAAIPLSNIAHELVKGGPPLTLSVINIEQQDKGDDWQIVVMKNGIKLDAPVVSPWEARSFTASDLEIRSHEHVRHSVKAVIARTSSGESYSLIEMRPPIWTEEPNVGYIKGEEPSVKQIAEGQKIQIFPAADSEFILSYSVDGKERVWANYKSVVDSDKNPALRSSAAIARYFGSLEKLPRDVEKSDGFVIFGPASVRFYAGKFYVIDMHASP